ncbi:SDR family NAD(P)-dependent oxidoreductase [Actinomadura luteofluorescens]|uniref:SDR family NAD(P)-dependent oxidoreductase n=1 Tax=Actinomadura luteofluorescens TaxID=46163 RepID=UPI003645C613
MAPFTGAEDLEGWWRTIDIDLGGTFACAQAVMPGMVERGGGRMVFTASEWGVIGWPDASAYSASKGASSPWPSRSASNWPRSASR